MRSLYVFSLSALTAGLLIIGVRGRIRQKTPLLNTLWHLTLAIIAMTVNYLVAVYVSDPQMVLFFHGIYVASYLWMLLYFLRLVLFYSQTKLINKGVSFLLFILALSNTVSMVLNTFLRHAFTFHDDTYLDGLTYHFYDTETIWYTLHLVYSYLLAFGIAAVLAYRLFTTQSVYRRRYIILLGIFMAMLLLDALYMLLQAPLDFNLFAYVVMGMLLYYFISVYIPHDLMTRVLSYASDSINRGIICLDDQGHMLYANADAYQLMQKEKGDPSLTETIKNMHLSHDPALSQDDLEWTDSVELNSGKVFRQIDYHVIRDAGGLVIGSYYSVMDKTEETLGYLRAKERATHDPLTGLYNMEGFVECVEEILLRDPDTPRFMLASNIRDFKLVNDLFGPEKGNEILIKIASLLKTYCREGEVCARLNGDRFVMLVERGHFREDTFLDNIYQISGLIRSNAYSLRVQIGVFAIEDLSMTPSQMIDRANVAINHIKNESISRVVYYSHQMMQNSRDEQQVINGLSEAIANGDLRIYLQPQVDAQGVVQGAEALVRWIHTEHGVLLPGHFIKVLEEAGLIYQLDHAVWEMACRTLASWRGTERAHLYISVNISPRDFYYIDLYKTFTELVAKYGIEPSKLHLEITESALVNDTEKQQTIVKKLRAFGFEIEIDDFGSGYSSLSMLKDLPVDTLKIDMEFLRETENRSRSRTILESVIQLSAALGMRVITEGVENKAQFAFLKGLGCTRFQGFYFSRPLPVREFEQTYFPAHTASSSPSAYFNARSE